MSPYRTDVDPAIDRNNDRLLLHGTDHILTRRFCSDWTDRLPERRYHEKIDRAPLVKALDIATIVEEIAKKSLRIAASDRISAMDYSNSNCGPIGGHARLCGHIYQILE
jgi:hypothetical protein